MSDAAFFTTGGSFTSIKRELLLHLLATAGLSTVHVAYDTTMHPRDLQQLRGSVHKARGKSVRLLPLSFDRLERKLGSNKLTGFAGGRNNRNPSVLGFFDACARSPHEYCWRLEDDVVVSNFSSLADEWRTNQSDLVCQPRFKLPFWYRRWEDAKKLGRASVFDSFVTDARHGLPDGTMNMVNTALFRTSRVFARSLLATIRNEANTSHHEIFLPFALRARNLSWAALRESARLQTSSHNPGRHLMGVCGFLRKARKEHTLYAHPIKRADCRPGERVIVHFTHA